MADPWEVNWRRIDEIGSGGQGTTRLVQRISDSGQKAALKILNRQRDEDRRKRMHREVAALQTISNHGVPKLLESNASSFGDLSIKLYLVSEFIEGSTVEKQQQTVGCTFSEAMSFGRRLVEIVAHCHSEDVIHRDIKPDNIILRGNSWGDPVLIDFGLSFNDADGESSLTTGNEQLGNRFLQLPELLRGATEGRDRRSDLTQCCGVLYYALTRQWPVSLLDGKGKKPHRRREARPFPSDMTSIQEDLLTQLFDRAFEQQLDSRFQAADDLLSALNAVATGKAPDPNSLATKVSAIRSALSGRDDIAANKARRAIAERFSDAIRQGWEALTKGAGGEFRRGHSLRADRRKDAVLHAVESMHHEHVSGRKVAYEIVVVEEAGAYVVTGKRPGGQFELGRLPRQDPINWEALGRRLAEFLADVANELVSKP